MKKIALVLGFVLVEAYLPAQLSVSANVATIHYKPEIKQDTTIGTQCLPPQVIWVETGDSIRIEEDFVLSLSVSCFDSTGMLTMPSALTTKAFKEELQFRLGLYNVPYLFKETFTGFSSSVLITRPFQPFSLEDVILETGWDPSSCMAVYDKQLQNIGSFVISSALFELTQLNVENIRFDFELKALTYQEIGIAG